MKKFLVLFCFFISTGFCDDHEFRGQHFLASYLECDKEIMEDPEQMMQIMLEAVGKSGAQILDYSSYVFPGNGVTMVILLSESHASIHTYPERAACFVDLFTCGTKCSHLPFDEVMQAYLKPQEVNHKLFIRDNAIVEIP